MIIVLKTILQDVAVVLGMVAYAVVPVVVKFAVMVNLVRLVDAEKDQYKNDEQQEKILKDSNKGIKS